MCQRNSSPDTQAMKRYLTVGYGAASYVVFLVAFLYAIAFVGDIAVPRSVDHGIASPIGQALVINVALLGLFAVQHSVMARPGFKRWWTLLVPRPVERSTYVLFASLALIALFVHWRPLTGLVWTVQDPLGAAIITAIFWFGWALLLISTFLLSHFELFGLSQVFARLLRRELPAP